MHKYKIGEAVSFVPGLLGVAGRGSYTVIQLLPPRGEEFQYRIKSINEPFERAVRESQLDRDDV